MNIEKLLNIMAALRAPESGCPWDRAQDFKSIASFTIEEAYEVADAIERRAFDELKDELGDLLFQVVFHAQMAKECDAFDFKDVVDAICAKMIRRHPHVFAGERMADAEAQLQAWESLKATERAEKAKAEGRTLSALDGVAKSLPASQRALKLQKRAARVGFDWDDPADVLAKVSEELGEVEQAYKNVEGDARVLEELGDLFFTCINLSRKLGHDPEDAMASANRKFERRFKRIEAFLAKDGRGPEQSDLEEMEHLWQRAKSEEEA
ncbi:MULTISPECIES: nucleoside triphosphate pyrophosphohydrolase [unclassified Iodidimonas]|jgi:ATP diphosphatase|uniref:nucleoside triphosphate pyrophosphohydrolase n=1 Tax=unclassified Iodidimonas TaxID=2626145 RepID=UPI0024825FE3|nr:MULTISPECIES: nucleoside triphosphate pyrophosphohydrolase [unclassified Iodidimonas]